MSRFSPTVRPESDGGLGDFGRSVADAIDGIRSRKRQRALDEQAQEDRTRRRTFEDETRELTREQAARQRILDAITLRDAGYREGEPPSDDVASALDAQRGNRLQGQGAAPPPVDPMRGNRVQSNVGGPGMDVADELDSQRGNTTQAGYQPTPQAPPAAGPSPMRQLGTQFYRLPGGMGYVDELATPDARKRRTALEDDQREHGQDLELEGVRHSNRQGELGTEHGYRGREAEAGHGYDLERDRAKAADDLKLEGARAGRENATDRRLAEKETAEGAALMRTVAAGGPKDPVIEAQGKAFKDVRSANPKWHPGRVMFHAQKALKESRPDLFPTTPKKADEKDEDMAWLEAQAAKRKSGGGRATSTAAPKTKPVAGPAEIQGGKRPVSQDQAEYLRSLGKWDDSKYEIR